MIEYIRLYIFTDGGESGALGWDVYFVLRKCVHIEFMNPRCASGYINVEREAEKDVKTMSQA